MDGVSAVWASKGAQGAHAHAPRDGSRKTHPLLPFRMALTTSFTPRLSILLADAFLLIL